MQVAFVPWKGIEVPSLRMRCYWIAKYWEDAIIAKPYELNGADVVVFQKGYQPPAAEIARTLKAEGRKVIWDLCDPDWWFYPKEFEAMEKDVDAVVCSSRALADDFAAEYPGHSPWVIPDRQDPEFHATVKEHRPVDMPVFVWFGWSQNRVALYGVFDFLEKLWCHGHRFKLLILDEDVYNKLDWFSFPVEHRLWSLERFHEDLLSADIALLPLYPGLKGILKSDNKKVTAMWAGLPVTDGYDYGRLRELIESVDVRKSAGVEGRKICEAQYDVRQSVEDWKRVIANFYAKKF